MKTINIGRCNLILLMTGILFIQNIYAQFNDTLQIDYFGQTPPGNTAKVFAPDFISRNNRFVQNCCFSQGGKEFVFVLTDQAWDHPAIMYTHYINGRWTEPDTLFDKASVPFFSYDGEKLYFVSGKRNGPSTADIWVTKRGNNGWQNPEEIKGPINTVDANEWEICESRNGSLYFSSDRRGGKGSLDVYRSRPENGCYANAENLAEPVNTVSLDECPYIAPDESYLVFNSWKYNPKYKGNNLYVSFRDKNGKWGEPKDMGDKINTDDLDIYPYITPDGKYFMFTRRENARTANYSRLYWISTSVIDSIRNSHSTAFQPLILTNEKLNQYKGVYSNSETKLKLNITVEGNHLKAVINKYPEPKLLEAIDRDIFYGHHLTFYFDLKNEKVTFLWDVSGAPGLVMTKEK
jgi:hypothetical protein